MKKKYLKILIIILVPIFLYLLAFIFRYQIQTYSTFPRMSYERINTYSGVEKIYLENDENEKIVGLYKDVGSSQIIFFFHGNGENLNDIEHKIKYLSSMGYDVLSYDYPGYGESGGFPSKDKVYEASNLFYKYLIENKNKKPEDIILYGYSIGTTVAVELASKKKISKLILMSPLTSRYNMAKITLGFTAQKIFFMKNSLNSIEKVKKIQVPSLVIHGQQDELIPFYMGEQIYSNLNSDNKYFISIENIGHNGIISKYGAELKPYIESFLSGDIKNKSEKSKIFLQSFYKGLLYI